jgi:ketosteroid isomerase-like protein
MSEENVEIIRRGYEDFAKGRIAFELLDPEIEWRGPREFPDLAELRHGREGVRQYIAQLNEVFNDYRMFAEVSPPSVEVETLSVGVRGSRPWRKTPWGPSAGREACRRTWPDIRPAEGGAARAYDR